jgi:hypothetical protein
MNWEPAEETKHVSNRYVVEHGTYKGLTWSYAYDTVNDYILVSIVGISNAAISNGEKILDLPEGIDALKYGTDIGNFVQVFLDPISQSGHQYGFALVPIGANSNTKMYIRANDNRNAGWSPRTSCTFMVKKV